MKSKLSLLVKDGLNKKLNTKWFKIINIILLVVIVGLFNIDNIIKSFGGDFDKDKYIYVNFYSLTNDKTYLKVRVLQDDVIIAESGLLKKNEFVEKLKMKRSLIESKRITYLVMSYEKDTYYSLGEVRLNPTLKK